MIEHIAALLLFFVWIVLVLAFTWLLCIAAARANKNRPVLPSYQHDRAIVDAAKEYIVARAGNLFFVDVGTEKIRAAWKKMVWMVDAKEHGWNPADYKP